MCDTQASRSVSCRGMGAGPRGTSAGRTRCARHMGPRRCAHTHPAWTWTALLLFCFYTIVLFSVLNMHSVLITGKCFICNVSLSLPWQATSQGRLVGAGALDPATSSSPPPDPATSGRPHRAPPGHDGRAASKHARADPRSLPKIERVNVWH